MNNKGMPSGLTRRQQKRWLTRQVEKAMKEKRRRRDSKKIPLIWVCLPPTQPRRHVLPPTT